MKRIQIIKIVHVSVLLIGFVIGFGFVPRVKEQFLELVSIPKTYKAVPDDETPQRPIEFPKAYAIIQKNENKWKR